MKIDIVKIPKRFFKTMKVVDDIPVWINGKLIENSKALEFQAALFDLTNSDYYKFQSQNTTLGFEDRKIYVKDDVRLEDKTEVIDHLGNKFRIVGTENYRQNGHADLIIYYLERLKDGEDRSI